jgi:hypothetical protein
MSEQPGVSRRNLLISGGLVAAAPLLGDARHSPSLTYRVHAPAQAEPIVDLPGIHNFFMFGSNTLYLEHMPMFTEEKHMYQVILRAELPADVMQGYRARQGSGRTPWNLVNSAQLYTLPQVKAGTLRSFLVDVFADYSNAKAAPAGQPFARNVPLTVREVVHFRHFDFNIPRPQHPTYLLFGRGGEAHLSHYIARDPDFQHIMTLKSAPAWLSADQLAACVEICLTDVPGTPVPCASPLLEKSYRVLFQGRSDARATLDLSGASSHWFSTGNLLNASDPCVSPMSSS